MMTKQEELKLIRSYGKTRPPTKAAAYIRTSTREGRQHVENQRRAIAEYCQAEGWTLTAEFHDQASGAGRDRPQLTEMLRQAGRRRFNVVIVWALDRLTRGGPVEAFKLIDLLKQSRVGLVSVQEPHFSTTGPNGELFISIAAWIAQQERERLSERIKAGLDRSRAAGGRRPGPDRIEINLPAGAHGSIRQLAAEAGVSPSTMQRYLKAQPQQLEYFQREMESLQAFKRAVKKALPHVSIKTARI